MKIKMIRPTENRHIARATGIVGGATLASRILGYIRDMLIAGYLGAGPFSDAFIAAFRLPNMLRRLYHDGTVSMAVVPVMTEVNAQRGYGSALGLARATIQVNTFLLLGLTTICALGAPLIIGALAYGLYHDPSTFHLAVDLQRMMSGYLFLIGMAALCMGLLNAYGHFAAPAVAPAFLNLAMIGAIAVAVAVSDNPRHWSYGLAIGVLVGGCLQLIVQIPFLIKAGIRFWHRADWRHPGLKDIRRRFLPVLFGGSVFQLNTLVGTLLASFLAQGSISYLYYADRLVQFPLGVVGIAAATAILPSLSRQAVAGDRHGLKQSFVYGMRMVSVIILPAMTGLIVLREPIVALLFERGAFNATASQLTSDAVLYYGVGLWAFAAVRIVIATFYALNDYRTPVRIGIISLLANTVLGFGLMQVMGHAGIALALTLASVLNLVLLLCPLLRRIGPLGAGRLVDTVVRSGFCAGLMGIAVGWLAIKWIDRSSLVHHLVGLLAVVMAGIIVYGLFTALLHGREISEMLRLKNGPVQKNG